MRVSIGIPFFNNARTLQDAIRSVFAQTFSDWELILMDDGSKDGSKEIAGKVKDPRVKLISDGQNRGLPTRLNQITELSRGQYVARMDADDLMHPDRIQKQIAYLDQNNKIDVTGTGIYTIDPAGKLIGIRGEKADFSSQAILKRGAFVHPTVMGRKEWFRKFPYNPKMVRSQDRELWCRCFSQTEFGLISEPLLFYREEIGSFKKYAATCKQERQIIQEFGPSLLGPGNTLLLVGKNYFKIFVHGVFAFLGIRNWIIGRRSRGFNELEQRQAEEILQRIRQTSVPGWDV